jgi:hypothetical protein
MSSWWRYPLSTQQLQRKCKDAALTHIYTEFGGGQHLCNNKDIWPYLSSFFCSQNTASVNQFVPAYMAEQVSSELSILYKSVLRKRVITPLMRMTSAQASLVRAGVV